MSRSRKYTRNQRAKAICRKLRVAHALFGGDFFSHNGCYSKNQIRLWRCARDRAERLPDKREAIAMIRLEEEKQAYALENNTNHIKGE